MGLTKQEVYNKVKDHLLAQGKPALDIRGKCAYRGSNGTKCAIGCLIPDSLYRGYFENTSVWSLTNRGGTSYTPEIVALFDKDALNQGFLARLQSIHDTVDPGDWPGKLNTLAEDYKLLA